MIKLKNIITESKSIITPKRFNDITSVIGVFYDSVVKLEHSKESRGEFIRITFKDYSEAINFYNTGDDLLIKIVKIQRSNNSSPGPKRVGNMFMVSYKLIED